MTDFRRAFLWMIFAMSLFLLWDGWQKHNGNPSLFSPGSAPARVAAPASGVPQAASSLTPALPAASTAPAIAAAPSQGQTLTVTTDLVKATFDSVGGSLVRVELLKHANDAKDGGHVTVLDRTGGHTYVAQTGLIGVAGAPTHLTPMTLLDDPRTLGPDQNTLTVRYASAEQGGLQWIKTYTLNRQTYAIDVRHELRNTGTAPVTAQRYLQLVRDNSNISGSGYTSTFTGPAVYNDSAKLQKIELKDLDKGKTPFEKQASDGWVAMIQHYFFSAWIHNDNVAREFYARALGNNLYAVGMVLPMPLVQPGQSVSVQDQLYVGPQEEKVLIPLAPGLERVKDYGIFTILAKPLFWLLDKLYGVLGNWGWAIVALVVLLKIAFYGLNASAYRSMAKMKAVNPKIMALRERYKDEPQKQQQEMMRIYKEEKVNPIGSCLPIFLQMPFFIALYWVLLSSVEMRHAPWIGWITDLSAKDPYFILPIVMVASSLFQVWLNPPAADPMQQRMMWIMPLAFGVMFFFFPAGLVLYWVVNNILSIAQQWMINKRLGVA